MHWWPSEISGRSVRRVFTDGPWHGCIWHAFGRPWCSMVSQQTCTCDHRVDRGLRKTSSTFDLLHSSHKWSTKQCCNVGNTALQCRLGTVSRLWLCGQSWRFEIDLGWNIVHILEATHLSHQVGCGKKTDMCITLSNRVWIFSLDLGFRMEGIPTLDLWEWVSDVFHSNTDQKQEVKASSTVWPVEWVKHPRSEWTLRETVQVLKDILNCLMSILSPHTWILHTKEFLLHIFEDIDAVIKMTTKGRSPTLRHVTRTHRVALDSNQKQKVKQARGNPLHRKVSEKRMNLQCNTQVYQRHLEFFP